jgi:hypothetical protein
MNGCGLRRTFVLVQESAHAENQLTAADRQFGVVVLRDLDQRAEGLRLLLRDRDAKPSGIPR